MRVGRLLFQLVIHVGKNTCLGLVNSHSGCDLSVHLLDRDRLLLNRIMDIFRNCFLLVETSFDKD